MTIGNKKFVVDLGWGALLANLGIASALPPTEGTGKAIIGGQFR